MKLIKGNREQLTCWATVLLSAFLVFALWGDGKPADTMSAQASERVYSGPPAAAAEHVHDGFQIYWEGRDIFSAAAVDKLDVPRIPAPSPRIEPIALPPLRPCAAFKALNKSSIALKYMPFDPAAPPVQWADIQAADEIGGLKTLQEPEVPYVEDRRAQKTREWDVIHFAGDRPAAQGRIILMNPGKSVDFKRKDSAIRETIQWNMIAIDNKTGEAWIERSWTWEEEYKDRAGRLQSGDVAGRLLLAEWCRGLGMMRDAAEEYRQAIEILSDRREFSKEFFECVARLGEILREASEYDEVLYLYRSVMEWTPRERPEMLGQIGDALRALGLYEGAYHAYRLSIDASPRYSRGRALIARTLYEMGSDSEAVEAVADLFAKYLDSTKHIERAEAGVARGLALLRMNDLKGAEDSLQEALRSAEEALGDPSKAVDGSAEQRRAAVLAAEALNAIGVVEILNGNVGVGPGRFVAAIRNSQYLTDAWLNLAVIALAAGRTDDAVALYMAAAQRDPARADAMAGLSVALFAAGQIEEGAICLMRAIEMEPGHAYAHYLKGRLELQAGERDKAMKEFEDAMGSEFYFIPVYTAAAAAYMAEAEAFETEATGDALFKASRKSRAEADRISARTLLEAVRDAYPDLASSHAALGCALAVLGRKAEAEASFDRAGDARKTPDPLLAYGRGYVEYWLGEGDAKRRLDAARAIFSVGAQMKGADDIDRMWIARCEEAAKTITDWLDTSVQFYDRFERPDSDTVGGGWFEHDGSYGIRIAVEKGRVKFSGRQAVNAMGLTQMERDVPKDDFLSFEVTLCPASGKFETGISLYFAQQAGQQWMGHHIGLDTAGRLRYQTTTNTDFAAGRLDFTGTDTNFAPPDPKEIRFKVARRGGQRGAQMFDISVWNPASSTWTVVTPPNGLPAYLTTANPSYRIAVWSRATIGQDYSLFVDDARVLLKRQNQ